MWKNVDKVYFTLLGVHDHRKLEVANCDLKFQDNVQEVTLRRPNFFIVQFLQTRQVRDSQSESRAGLTGLCKAENLLWPD